MGFEIFDSGIFLGRKIWQVFFWWLYLSRDFLGVQTEDFPHLPDAEKITSAGMMNKHTKTFNTRLLKGTSVYSHNCNNHNETDVL